MSSIASALPPALESGLAGMTRHRQSLDDTAARLSKSAVSEDTPSLLVRLVSDRRGFQASARVVRAADESLGTLVDRFV